ncbi:lasso peptide biosynthesis B2 protein [Sphingomonas sp. RB1R13]|uniref:lasso peptide biosynthesis B2 protein n=1 Tax=Sphingomonas sp. RB1R13 TaxID=3096159 RepID=UPI002FCB5D98
MKVIRQIRHVASLGWSGNLLLVEAIAALAAAAAAIRFLSFRRAVNFGAVPLGEPRENATALADELSWTVGAAARILPFRTVCFQQGLALQRMVRRRGIDARLHYAIGKDETDRLAAHVWVSADGRALIGEQHDNIFMTVATYP